MDVFPARNLGAGEPWGRTVEDVLRKHDITVQSSRQDTDNNGRTVQASIAQLNLQTQRMDALVQQLDETIDRMPRYSLNLHDSQSFAVLNGSWTTASNVSIDVPIDRNYAIISCETVVQMTSPAGVQPSVVWMSLTMRANGVTTNAPTGIGAPMSYINTASAALETGVLRHTFFVDNVAGEKIEIEARLYATDNTAFGGKDAKLSASGLFLKDKSHILGGGLLPGTLPPVDPEGPGTPGGGGGATSQFKWPMNPTALNTRNGRPQDGYKTAQRPTHNGVDMSFPPAFYNGMPIRAIADGRVVRAYWEPGGGGWYVELDHGRFRSGYAHGGTSSNSTFRVSNGQTVRQGQHLMDAGSTGNSTGPHLHFQVSDMNKTGSFWTSTIDPEAFMAQYNPGDLYV